MKGGGAGVAMVKEWKRAEKTRSQGKTCSREKEKIVTPVK